MKRLEKLLQFALGQIPPPTYRDPGHAQRTDPDAPQAVDRNPGRLHHQPHDVVHPLVDDDLENHAFSGLTEDAELFGDDPPTLDDHPVTDSLQRAFARPGQRQDVVLLVQLVPGVHHPISDVAVVGENQ